MLEALEMGKIDPHLLLHAYSARLLATSSCSGRTPAMGVSWALVEGSDLLIKLKAYVDDHLLGTAGESVLANQHSLFQ